VIWTGPVLAPVLVSVLIISAGAAIGVRERRGRPVRVGIHHWVLGAVSFVLLLASFFANHGVAIAGGVPERFPWLLFGAGFAAGLIAAIDLLRRA